MVKNLAKLIRDTGTLRTQMSTKRSSRLQSEIDFSGTFGRPQSAPKKQLTFGTDEKLKGRVSITAENNKNNIYKTPQKASRNEHDVIMILAV